jgi:hypothetical protein
LLSTANIPCNLFKAKLFTRSWFLVNLFGSIGPKLFGDYPPSSIFGKFISLTNLAYLFIFCTFSMLYFSFNAISSLCLFSLIITYSITLDLSAPSLASICFISSFSCCCFVSLYTSLYFMNS